MKFRRKKQMRLDELIKCVWDNGEYPCKYQSNFNGEVTFRENGKFSTDESFISPHSTFTVEVEEDVTEETRLDNVTNVYYRKAVSTIDTMEYSNITIAETLETDSPGAESLAIYYGKTLIWTKEHGIPEDGVLEV